MAQSVICMENGQITWLHQGVRERGNLKRRMLPYRITTCQKLERKRLVLLVNQLDQRAEEKDDAEVTATQQADASATSNRISEIQDVDFSSLSISDSVVQEDKRSTESTNINNKSYTRGGKMQLTVSDEGRRNLSNKEKKQSNSPRPHIYMDSNDPELEDYDEEDPDDDLDI